MSNKPKFSKQLGIAWQQYQDLHDRYHYLLFLLGSGVPIEEIREQFAADIDYAMDSWNSTEDLYE